MTTVSAPDWFVLGCSQLGNLNRITTDDEAWETLETAWDAGVRHFDTAPHYGAGLSERRVGAFLATKPREEFTVSTKVGRLLVADPDLSAVPDDEWATTTVEGFVGADRRRRVLDHSGDGVVRSLDESLTRLGLDRVDTVYVHDPDRPDQLERTIREAVPALAGLREQGVLAHVGAGMNHAAPLTRLVRETGPGQVDQIMVAGRVTVLDRDGEQTLLPACVERGVGVVAAAVFNSGVLADPRPGASYDYGQVPTEVLHRAVRIKELCQRYDVPLRAAALQHPLRRPAVTHVAVGCRGRTQVLDNLAMAQVRVPDDLWHELDAGTDE